MNIEDRGSAPSAASVLRLLDGARQEFEAYSRTMLTPVQLAGRLPAHLADLDGFEFTWIGWSVRHAVPLLAVEEAGGTLCMSDFNAVLDRAGYNSRGRGGWWQGKSPAVRKITTGSGPTFTERVELTDVGRREVAMFRKFFPGVQLSA